MRTSSYEVVRRPFAVDVHGRPLPFRLLTNEETGKREFVEGYSDHLPVRVTIGLTTAGGEP